MVAQHTYHVSFVLATHNRRDVLVPTLERLQHCGFDRDDVQIILVDNASTDGTVEAARDQCDEVIPLDRNAGSCAKAFGVPAATGRYIVFLDDDSCPQTGSVQRMVEHFQNDPDLGAAGFSIHLPDGGEEGAALPGVFVGCGVGFRSEALRDCGGLDRTFFMQAEEYDLAFRLVGAGWRVQAFDDLHVDHQKTNQARKSERTTYFDIRNNLRVAARYLPAPMHHVYRSDWTHRYAWLAENDGHGTSFRRGLRDGRWRGVLERWTRPRRRLSNAHVERFFRWEYIERQMAAIAAQGVGRIVLADLGKNVYAYLRAAQRADLDILAIGDDRFAKAGRRYRGLMLVPLDEALSRNAEAVVVANCSTVHGKVTAKRVVSCTTLPVYHWWGSEEPRNVARTPWLQTTAPADVAGVARLL